jgi:sugar lactone lactonase YvrE
MQDGTADHISPAEPYGTNFAGSWPINNQVMYEALEFAGYDVKLEMGTDGHSTKQGGAILPDALRWLWRDYPAPIMVHEPAAAQEPGYDSTDRVFSTIYADKPWVQVGGILDNITSLTADASGNVYLASDAVGTERVDPQGKITQFAKPPNDASVVRMGANDRLYAYSPSGHDIVSSSTATGVASDQKTIAQNLAGPVDRVVPADFVVTGSGTIYFLDRSTLTIGVIDAAGQRRVALSVAAMADEDEMPAAEGLALSPDQSMIVVTDDYSRYNWSFQIAADGSLQNGEPFYRMELPETTVMNRRSGTSGAIEDTNGNVYFATPLGIQVAMQNGRIMQILNPPIAEGGPLTAITFDQIGDQSWLYAAQDGKLFRRPVKVTGANAWTVVKPPKPTL